MENLRPVKSLIELSLIRPDDSITRIGTLFHELLLDGKKPRRKQILFARISGYAFAVADNTWHSADPVGPEGEKP